MTVLLFKPKGNITVKELASIMKGLGIVVRVENEAQLIKKKAELGTAMRHFEHVKTMEPPKEKAPDPEKLDDTPPKSDDPVQ